MNKIVLCSYVLISAGCGFAAFAQTVVPTHTLRPGDEVSESDVKLLDTPTPGVFSDVSQVIGLEVQRALYRGRPIGSGDVGAPALVERNQIVTIIFETGALSIETEGRALGRGGLGDRLKVLNLSSKNTVVGRVAGTGEVIVNQAGGQE